jgi:subtilisin family serine protease
VLDENGTGWSSGIVAAIDWCIENKDTYDISVISMSLSDGLEHSNPQTECDPRATAISITAAVDQGIFVTAASGNEAYTEGISFPACASDAVSVGSVYDTTFGRIVWEACTESTSVVDQIVCHTNRNELLDLVAPAALITSTIPGNGFSTYGGTSMATPHPAGVAALLLEKNPDLTPVRLKKHYKPRVLIF